MAFATYYTYEGELKHIGKNELAEKRDELLEENNECWNKIALIMAMPPMDQKDEDGNVIHWADYVQEELQILRETIEDNLSRVAHINDAIWCQDLDPKSVHDDADEWDDEKDDWKES